MTFDVLIRGARVVDGTGNPWRFGDVALAGDRVAPLERAGTIPDAAIDLLVAEQQRIGTVYQRKRESPAACGGW